MTTPGPVFSHSVTTDKPSQPGLTSAILASAALAILAASATLAPSTASATPGHPHFEAFEPAMSLRLGAGSILLGGDTLTQDHIASLGGIHLGLVIEASPHHGLDVGISGYKRISEHDTITENKGLAWVAWRYSLGGGERSGFFSTLGIVGSDTQRHFGGINLRQREMGALFGAGYQLRFLERWGISVDTRTLLLGLTRNEAPFNNEGYVENHRGDLFPNAWGDAPSFRLGLTSSTSLFYRW